MRGEKPIIGWREWVSLPELGIRRIKPKIDTGARSSSLHTFDVAFFVRRGARWVRFRVHPLQRDSRKTVTSEAEVVELRRVKASSGHVSLRPVIVTTLELLDRRWSIELTLADRMDMSFRMLLGREAIRDRFVVDPGRSYYGEKPRPAAGERKPTKRKIVKKRPRKKPRKKLEKSRKKSRRVEN